MVMPFRLKDARANYQRMTTTVLNDLMHGKIEVNVIDTIIDSK